MADQGQDRVAAVVARVERMAGPRGTYPKQVLPYLVKALDAAGLLLTEARRERIVDALCYARGAAQSARNVERDATLYALLRELAGDGGSGVEVPTVITTAPRRMAANPGALIQPRHMTEHEESTWCQLAVPPCQPVAAAGVGPEPARPHCDTRHDPYRTCPQPAPAHEHRWAAVAGDAWTGNERGCFGWRVTREHCTRGDCAATREVGHGA